MNYGVKNILGIRHGYLGLNEQAGEPPVSLTMEMVEDIHREGGTILGTSRGPQDPAKMVDFMEKMGINILFCIGGDGTQRGAHQIYEECTRRGAKIAIVGIPKTIDNDIQYCTRSFGLVSAVEQAEKVISCAHVESKGAVNGIGLVKVMGRDAGYIAAFATSGQSGRQFYFDSRDSLCARWRKGFLKCPSRTDDLAATCGYCRGRRGRPTFVHRRKNGMRCLGQCKVSRYWIVSKRSNQSSTSPNMVRRSI